MKNDTWMGVAILMVILAILFFGKNSIQLGLLNYNSTTTPSVAQEQNQADIQRQIIETQAKADKLKVQIQAEDDKKTKSQYKDIVSLAFINQSNDPAREYLAIHVNESAKTTIDITGWTLISTSTGNSVTIPKATDLYFTGTINSEGDIYAKGGDTIYLITGISPIGYSFQINKCSGYLSQFQTFNPYIYNMCPSAKNENQSSIPKIASNDECLAYIDSIQICKTQTENLPVNWSYECKNFINNLNYPSCVNTHKNDSDFYQHEWRVYLKRSSTLWKTQRENIVLYDNQGKVVSTLKY